MRQLIILIVATSIIFHSCITIKESALRSSTSESLELANCEISLTGAVYMNILGIIKTNFIPAGVEIKVEDKMVYIDPVIVDDNQKADYIFITHCHADHFSKSDIQKLIKHETIIIGPKTVTKKIKNSEIKTAIIGDTIDFGTIKCEVVESYNINSKIHSQGSKYIGYIISCDTTRIYIAGDTDLIPEMKEFEDITVAILPIGEGKTAMNPQSAAKAANLIKPKIVIPVHYELEQNRENEFIELVDRDIKVEMLK